MVVGHIDDICRMIGGHVGVLYDGCSLVLGWL